MSTPEVYNVLPDNRLEYQRERTSIPEIHIVYRHSSPVPLTAGELAKLFSGMDPDLPVVYDGRAVVGTKVMRATPFSAPNIWTEDVIYEDAEGKMQRYERSVLMTNRAYVTFTTESREYAGQWEARVKEDYYNYLAKIKEMQQEAAEQEPEPEPETEELDGIPTTQ